MRTIRNDELIWCLFDGTRKWSAADRNLLTGHRPGELERLVGIPAGKLADRLRFMEMYDAAGNDLARGAIVQRLGAEILALRKDLRQSFPSKIPAPLEQTRIEVAVALAAALSDLHMLADTLEPPPFNLSWGKSSGVPAIDDPYLR